CLPARSWSHFGRNRAVSVWSVRRARLGIVLALPAAVASRPWRDAATGRCSMCGVQTAARLAGALCVSAGLLAAWASGLHAEQRNGPSSNPSSFPSVTRGAAAERGGPSARVTEPQASSRNLRGRLVRADVIVRHQLFEANGRSLGPLPDVRYRLSRELRNGRWVDRLDIVQPPAVLVTYPDGVRAVPNPFAGRGVERVDGEDEVMVIGADGKPR